MDNDKLLDLLNQITETQHVHEGVLKSVTDAVRRLYIASGNGGVWDELIARLDREIGDAEAFSAPNVIGIDGQPMGLSVEVLQRIRERLAGPQE